MVRLSTKRAYTVIAFALFLAISYACYEVWNFYQIPLTETVTWNGSGFTPKEVLIQKGGTVRFVNDSTTPVWPASDSHPSHNRLKGFDPAMGVVPGASWSFTFENAGVWDFHNHLEPRYVGRILVVGALGESTESCLAATQGGTRPQCWEADLQTELKRRGLDAAFTLFENMYSESTTFKENCHDVMHVLGKAAYQRFKIDGSVLTRESTRFCGYGFYHGFIETMLSEEGLHTLDSGHRYCTSLLFSEAFPTKVSALNASQACYHGIGHALFDSIDASLWGDPEHMVKSVEPQCESLSVLPSRREACMSGVYNALANAMTASNYNLAFTTTGPLRICHEQKDEYQLKCSLEIGVGYLNHYATPFSRSFPFIRTIEKIPIRLEVLAAFINGEARQTHRGSTPQSLARECTQLRDASERRACVRGLVSGVSMQGKPGEEYVETFSVCPFFEEPPLRSYCISRARDTLAFIFNTDKIQAFCATLAPSDQSICSRKQGYVPDI
ncbi:hypothetical protein EBR66_03925 [bacterium]|nr:hypothetical protein [bacterium]